MSKFDKIIEKIEKFEETATKPMSADNSRGQAKMGKFDKLVQKIELFEKLALYGNRETFLDRLAQQADAFSPEEVEQWNAPKPGPAVPPIPPDQSSVGPLTPPPAMNAHAPREQAKPGVQYPYINPEFQKLLGVTPDGSLGPETRKALDNYKTNVLKSPGLSDGVAFGHLSSGNVKAKI